MSRFTSELQRVNNILPIRASAYNLWTFPKFKRNWLRTTKLRQTNVLDNNFQVEVRSPTLSQAVSSGLDHAMLAREPPDGTSIETWADAISYAVLPL